MKHSEISPPGKPASLFRPWAGRILYFLKTIVLSDERIIREQYRHHHGAYPDLSHPVRFTEKIQWLKVHDRNPLLTTCADKLEVRRYVARKAGEHLLIPLLFTAADPGAIPFHALPPRYIIKTNHGSGTNIAVTVPSMYIGHQKQEFNQEMICKILKKWLKTNNYYRNREWEYKHIRPRIIIEELLQDDTMNEVLNDYKIHCFNGVPLFIQTIFDRYTSVKETWYDTHWKMLDLWYFSSAKKDLPRPPALTEMLTVAGKLSRNFTYVRVDLYTAGDTVYFGELTFHPYSGLMKFNPDEWDYKLGELLKLPVHEQ